MNGSFSWKNVGVVAAVVVPLVTLYIPTMFKAEDIESKISDIEASRHARCIENNKGKESINILVTVLSESIKIARERDLATNTQSSLSAAQQFEDQLKALKPAPLLDCGQEPTPK